MRRFHVFAVLLESHRPLCWRRGNAQPHVGAAADAPGEFAPAQVPAAIVAAYRDCGAQVLRFELYPVGEPQEAEGKRLAAAIWGVNCRRCPERWIEDTDP